MSCRGPRKQPLGVQENMLTYLNELADRLKALATRLEEGDNSALKDSVGPLTEALLVISIPGMALALMAKLTYNLLT